MELQENQRLSVVTEATACCPPWPYWKATVLLKVTLPRGMPAMKLIESEVSVKSDASMPSSLLVFSKQPVGLVR